MHETDHWTDQIHLLLMGFANFVNRIDVDSRLLAASDVKLDRALFPLLSRLSLYGPMTTVDLANLVGRDHSTVSRQIAKLETLGLVDRLPDPSDARARLLQPSEEGDVLLKKIARVRRSWIEQHFRDWSVQDRDQLITLMERVMASNSPASDPENGTIPKDQRKGRS